MEENNNLKSSIALRKIPVTLKGGNSEIEDKKVCLLVLLV